MIYIINDNILMITVLFSMVDYTQLCRQKHDINTVTRFAQVHIIIYYTTLRMYYREMIRNGGQMSAQLKAALVVGHDVSKST